MARPEPRTIVGLISPSSDSTMPDSLMMLVKCNSRGKMNAKRDFLCGFLAVAALFTAGTSRSFAEDAAVAAALTKMEDRLLEHDYHTESDDARLNRLEKFVFGAPETGTPQVRVARLNAAIVPESDSESASAPQIPSQKKSASAGSSSSSGQQRQAAANPATSKPSATPAYSQSDFGSYPRVAELEQQIFGKTFDSDPLPVRVSRLETKEFGRVSKEDDLCDRIDKLDQLVLKTNPDPVQPRYTAAPAPSLTPYGLADGSADAPAKPVIENPFTPGSAQVKGVEQRTSTLEKFVFGHEHFGKPLAERVARLEKKLVPYEHQSDKDIATRVDHLWTMLSAANTTTPSMSTD